VGSSDLSNKTKTILDTVDRSGTERYLKPVVRKSFRSPPLPWLNEIIENKAFGKIVLKCRYRDLPRALTGLAACVCQAEETRSYS